VEGTSGIAPVLQKAGNNYRIDLVAVRRFDAANLSCNLMNSRGGIRTLAIDWNIHPNPAPKQGSDRTAG
jgi:hypothetical protein